MIITALSLVLVLTNLPKDCCSLVSALPQCCRRAGSVAGKSPRRGKKRCSPPRNRKEGTAVVVSGRCQQGEGGSTHQFDAGSGPSWVGAGERQRHFPGGEHPFWKR